MARATNEGRNSGCATIEKGIVGCRWSNRAPRCIAQSEASDVLQQTAHKADRARAILSFSALNCLGRDLRKGLRIWLGQHQSSPLAAHYSKLEPKLLDEKPNPTLVEQGARIATARRCASCHLPSLVGQDQMPRLAKQRIDYLIDQMRAYLTDKRSGADTAMTASILSLADDDIVALAHYVASR